MAVIAGAAGGCARQEAFDRNGPDVVSARQPVLTQATEAVRMAVRGLAEYTSSALDVCVRGQDSRKVRDPYRVRCTAGYVAVAGVPGADPAEASTFVADHLTSVGCSGDLRAHAGAVEALEEINDAQTGPQTVYLCASCFVEVQLVRSDDPAVQNGTAGRSLGWINGQQPVDVPAAVAAAAADGHRYALIARTVTEYYTR